MIKYYHEKKKAHRFSLNIEGNVHEYALSLLNIINHVRIYPHAFYKVENSDSNVVYVTCSMDDIKSVREYLENFGKINWEEDINWFVISAQYDKKGYEEFFGVDCDCEVDFTVEIE